MKQQVFSHNLPQLFLKARDSLMAHFRPILHHFDLTEQQWRIMRVLDEHAQLEPREICDMCLMLSSSMAGMLARMEEMDLISRQRMPEDQRRVMVRLTPHGIKIMRQMVTLIDQQYQHLEQAIGKPALKNLVASLESFIAAEHGAVSQVDLPG